MAGKTERNRRVKEFNKKQTKEKSPNVQKNKLNNYFSPKDNRVACKYGESCYQTSDEHLKTFKHSSAPKFRPNLAGYSKADDVKSPEKKEKVHDLSSSEDEESEAIKPKKFLLKKRKNEENLSITNKLQKSDSVKSTVEKANDSEDDNTEIETGKRPIKLLVKQNQNKHKSPDKPGKPLNSKKLKGKSMNFQIFKTSNKGVESEDEAKIPRNSEETKKKKRSVLDESDSIKPNELEEIINDIYGVNGMPTDFYHFWKFCSTITPKDPTAALIEPLGFKLVGPFEVLLNPDNFHIEDAEEKSKILCKNRFYYDPPEFQTCIVSTEYDKDENESGFHLGYYRDDPNSKSSFVAFNSPGKQCTLSSYKIQPLGDNLFGAICSQIAHLLQKLPKKDPKRDNLERLKFRLKRFLSDRDLTGNYNLDRQTPDMKARQKSVATKCFHGAGISVKLDPTGVGYRELPESDANLRSLFTKITNKKNNSKKGLNDILLPVEKLVNLVQFANDECDFGMGLELGLDLLSYGDPIFHPFILHLLPVAYDLLSRPQYSRIIEAHIKHRENMFGAFHWCLDQNN